MLVIGIVGGVASGKSLVAGAFQRLGAAVIDADQIAHDVLQDPDVVERLTERWGIDVLRDDQQIDRAAVAARVFGPVANAQAEREFLTSLTHPRIGERIASELERYRSAGREAVVLDAPLLLEVGLDRLCDVVVMVDCDPAVRQRRAANRGWTAEQFRSREAAQHPLSSKRAAAGFVIRNDGSPEETSAQVDQLWRQWREQPSSHDDSAAAPDRRLKQAPG